VPGFKGKKHTIKEMGEDYPQKMRRSSDAKVSIKAAKADQCLTEVKSSNIWEAMPGKKKTEKKIVSGKTGGSRKSGEKELVG